MILFKDNFFFFLQACCKNIEFRTFEKIRPFLYRPFFGKLGKNARISSGVIFKYPREIYIGKGSYIGNNCMVIGSGKVTIGEYALIGAGTKIITTYHNTTDPDIPYAKQGISYKDVEIGSNVWMGFDVKILHGCVIGENVIIGAGSVLTPNSVFPNNATIAGIPSKIIKA